MSHYIKSCISRKRDFFLVYHICPLFSTKNHPHLEQLFGMVFAVSIDRWNEKETKMKKCMKISLLGMLILLLAVPGAFARGKKFRPAENYLNLSLFVFYPCSIGYKHLAIRNIYLTGNLDYDSDESDLLLQAGAAYMIPRKFAIFRFYGGGGMEFSRNNGYLYPYVMAGTNFWVFFTEIVHPLRNNKSPGYRLGFSLSF
jgi:hypothetical protein